MAKKSSKKGNFSDVDLSLAKRYIFPAGRSKLLLVGVMAGIVCLGYFTLRSMSSEDLFSTGPLSSSHASLESDCSACHDNLRATTDSSCQSCHEKTGAVLTFEAHLDYHTARGGSGKRKLSNAASFACIVCHSEHQGRNTDLSQAADGTCLSCHQQKRFEDEHGEFAALKTDVSDDPNLFFPHIMHVQLIQSSENVSEAEIEGVCQQCHEPQKDGRHFRDIQFDRHCSECHLSSRRDPQHGDMRAVAGRRSACKLCHRIDGRDIEPVQHNQIVLTGAKFDHQAHRKVMQCTQCHNRIQLLPSMPATDARDDASTLNIPGIDNCRQCHNKQQTSDNCVLCHQFHPGT